MSSASVRAYFMLLGGAVVAPAPVLGECAPYTKGSPSAANINLAEPLTPVSNLTANTNLCEAMT